MILIEKTVVYGWEAAIRGLRNPMNSWERSDTIYGTYYGTFNGHECIDGEGFTLGENDKKLMLRMNSSSEQSKYRRMITVTTDAIAPLYWWNEYDTYKVGTVANSCSKMHKLMSKPFELKDFSFDKIIGYEEDFLQDNNEKNIEEVNEGNFYKKVATPLTKVLNELREEWLKCEDPILKKGIWYTIIQLLPESYNQKRTIQLNYEVLASIYKQRKNHKLDEWRIFCEWIKTLPYSELITGIEKQDEVLEDSI